MNFVAGDVDPVQISSLLDNTGVAEIGVSPAKIPAQQMSQATHQGAAATGNTPLKGRRK